MRMANGLGSPRVEQVERAGASVFESGAAGGGEFRDAVAGRF